MRSQLRITAITFLSMLSAYFAYVLAAVPFIEPPVTERTVEDVPTEAPSPVDTRKLADLFEPGAWERQNPKVVETDYGMLLIKDYTPTTDGRMELKPCTLVFYRAGKGGVDGPKQPIVLQAPEGAVLQFDRSLDLRRAEFGRLVGGRLSGEVTVRARESKPGAGDDLEFVTRNIQMDQERIWTPHDVRFRLGESRGSGRDLLITLARGKNAGDTGAVMPGRIKSLELVHVDKVYLQVSKAKPAEGKENKAAPESRDTLAASAPVEITCKGPFQFDFEQQVASFEDQVDVVRPVPNGPSDQINCQLLEAHFGAEKPADAAEEARLAALPPDAVPAAPAKRKSPLPQGLGLKRLVALGHPVLVRAPSVSASLKAERLEYDISTRRIRLEDERGVQMQRQRQRIEAPSLLYEMPADGGLGLLWAAGPGKFTGPLREGDTQEVEASWKKTLHLRPHEGAHVLSLQDGGVLKFPGLGALAAQQIHLWLKQVTPPAKPQAATDPKVKNENLAPGKQDAAKTTLIPEKLLALGQVQLDSPQFAGNTERLELWIQQQHSAGPANGAATGPLANSPDRTRPNVIPVGSSNGAPQQKLGLSGNLVRIQMANRPTGMALVEATVDGNVKLAQLGLANPNEPPLVISGSTLYLKQNSDTDALLRVIGRPAQISARGLTIAGTNVQLDRAQNHVWIEGPGEMDVPLAGGLLPTKPAAPAAPPSPVAPVPAEVGMRLAAPPPVARNKTPATAHVTWNERVDFNGATLRFVGQVLVTTPDQTARAKALDAVLSNPIDFGGARPAKEMSIREVILREQVTVESRGLDERGQLASIERLEAQQISFDQSNGDIAAIGPGWVSTVRVGQAAALPGAPAAAPGGALSLVPVPPVAGAAAAAKPDTLSYLRVGFQRGISGNANRHEIKFHEQVRVVYGPVTGWDQTLSAARVEDLGPEGIVLECEQLSLAEMILLTGTKRPLELVAEGNARIEGRTFNARAQRMAYTQLKDQLVLEGAGRSDAELWRQTQPGAPSSHAAARKIIYWRKDNRVEVEDARFFDLNQVGGRVDAPKR